QGRRDGAYVGEEPGQVEGLRLVEFRDRTIEVAVGAQEAGPGEMPPVSVLRQRSRFAERLAGLEVVFGGVELTVFAQDVGEPDVQVAGGRERPPRVLLPSLQRLLVQTPGLRGAAARLPHVGQDDGGAEF